MLKLKTAKAQSALQQELPISLERERNMVEKTAETGTKAEEIAEYERMEKVKEVRAIPLFMTAAVTQSFDADMPSRGVELVESWKGPQEEDLKPDEMIVRMLFSSVNPIDYKINTGKLPLEWLTLRPPFVGGRDGCGEVVALGSQAAQHFKLHDIVMGTCDSYKFGTFGQYSTFNWKDVCLKPPELSVEHAAGIPMVLLTAWECFSKIKNPRAMKRIFINGGAGGVGSWLILLAKNYFNIEHVVATCRGVNKSYVEELGADEIIDYVESPNFDEILLDKYKFSGDKAPFDCVFDTIGGDEVMERGYKLLDKNGYFITTVPIQYFDNEHSVPKELIGYSWTYMKNKLGALIANKPTFYSVHFKPDGNTLKMLVDWVVQNKLDKKLQYVKYPLTEIRTALDMSYSRHADGKLIVDMSLVV